MAGTSTRSPVLGFRPMRGLRCRMRKEPKPRISILSPPCRAADHGIEDGLDDDLAIAAGQVAQAGHFFHQVCLGHFLLASAHSIPKFPACVSEKEESVRIWAFVHSASWRKSGRVRKIRAPSRARLRIMMARVFDRAGGIYLNRALQEEQRRDPVSQIQHRDSGVQRKRPHSRHLAVGGRLRPRARLECRSHRGQRRLARQYGGSRAASSPWTAPEVRLLENPTQPRQRATACATVCCRRWATS